jgi:hypothetical protein
MCCYRSATATVHILFHVFSPSPWSRFLSSRAAASRPGSRLSSPTKFFYLVAFGPCQSAVGKLSRVVGKCRLIGIAIAGECIITVIVCWRLILARWIDHAYGGDHLALELNVHWY